MCTDCGCQEANKREVDALPDDNHGHHHHHEKTELVSLEMSILDKNDAIAAQNRAWFESHDIAVINLMSSPGSGKTSLLEKTLQRLAGQVNIAVIVGDLQMDHDAKRLQNLGARVKQINTVSSCHLDAAMIAREIKDFVDESVDLLIIENVGNLVCPAAFDLGEGYRIALLSTPEGEDKPSKYPVLFHRADVVLLTKTDLIPYLDWELGKYHHHLRLVNAGVPTIEVSVRKKEGIDAWLNYLEGLVKNGRRKTA